MPVHPKLLGLEAEGQAQQLRQVQHREAELPAHGLGRDGLLEVEVEVAKGSGHDQAVSLGIDRVAQVTAGHL